MSRYNSFRSGEKASQSRLGQRTRWVGWLFAFCSAVLVGRAWLLQVKDNRKFLERARGQQESQLKVDGKRGSIVDRNGHELAVSAMVPSLYAVPKSIANPQETARRLAGLLRIDSERLETKLSSKRSFVWVKRKLTLTERDKVRALKLDGLDFRNEPKRFYPNQSLAGAVIGFAGIDGVGLEGVERDCETLLAGKDLKVRGLRDALGHKALPTGSVRHADRAGATVELTLDSFIQEVAEDALYRQVKAMDASGGVVVVMEPNSGDILALAQTPSFDPNSFRSHRPADWRNRAITDVLEPGSTIKPLLIASALDAGVVGPGTVFDGHKGRLRIGRKVITDVHPEKRLPLLDIIKVSSNVGATQVAQRLGKERWYQYLRAFGFGRKTTLALRGEQQGVLRSPRSWGQIHLATSSYGYGFNATPIQIARAYSVLANGGMLVEPRLIRRILSSTGEVLDDRPIQVAERVVSPEAIRWTRDGMVRVTNEGGTGTKARVDGYTVAGKTGTAYKVDPAVRGYSKDKVWASFGGFVPAEKPALVIYVAIDEPQNAQYGGVVAAPIFSVIAAAALPYMGITSAIARNEPDERSELLVTAPVDKAAKAWRWWVENPNLSGNESKAVVPNFTGLTVSEAITVAHRKELSLKTKGVGIASFQNPEPGRLVPIGTPVAIEFIRPAAWKEHNDATR